MLGAIALEACGFAEPHLNVYVYIYTYIYIYTIMILKIVFKKFNSLALLKQSYI